VQLVMRDVCRYLDVTESMVTRWIKQRGLPAQHVGGQYRFHRAELLEWANAHQVKVAPEMFQEPDSDEEPTLSLADALEAGGIFYALADTNKEDALRSLIDVLPLPEGIDRVLLLRLFLAREAAASTAIGGGIALPHVRNPIVLNVDRPLVTLGFLDRPVDFGALDGAPVHVLFSLICPTTRSHLQMLSRLSYALHEPKLRDVVLRAGPREDILQAVRAVEASLAGKAAD
jgi:nitrogen PTS system EIIA component